MTVSLTPALSRRAREIGSARCATFTVSALPNPALAPKAPVDSDRGPGLEALHQPREVRAARQSDQPMQVIRHQDPGEGFDLSVRMAPLELDDGCARRVQVEKQRPAHVRDRGDQIGAASLAEPSLTQSPMSRSPHQYPLPAPVGASLLATATEFNQPPPVGASLLANPARVRDLVGASLLATNTEFNRPTTLVCLTLDQPATPVGADREQARSYGTPDTPAGPCSPSARLPRRARPGDRINSVSAPAPICLAGTHMAARQRSWVLVPRPWQRATGKVVRSALRKGQERMGERVDEAVARLGSIETQIANLHREMAHVQGELARRDQRFDSLDRRPDRIERRLDLADAVE
jgi:hypothetical protein